jgi:ribosomal protein L7/L12
MNAALLSTILLCLGLVFILAMVVVALYLRNQQVKDSIPETQRLADPAFAASLEKQIEDLLAQDKKIEAIKTYRQATGVSLKEAMDAVENIGTGSSWRRAKIIPADKHDQITELLRQNRQIEAIRLYREVTGAGLKEAKDAVEEIVKSL